MSCEQQVSGDSASKGEPSAPIWFRERLLRMIWKIRACKRFCECMIHCTWFILSQDDLQEIHAWRRVVQDKWYEIFGLQDTRLKIRDMKLLPRGSLLVHYVRSLISRVTSVNVIVISCSCFSLLSLQYMSELVFEFSELVGLSILVELVSMCWCKVAKLEG